MEVKISMEQSSMRTDISLWETYHARARLSGISVQANPPEELPMRSKSELVEVRRIITYLVRLSQIVGFPGDQNRQISIALFDRRGILLKLLPAGQRSSSLYEWGLRDNTAWRMTTIGPNAITVGLLEHCSLCSCGAENYQKVLQDYAIYFSPISVLRIADHLPGPYGGLAIITPAEEANSDFLTFVSAAAHDLALNLHFTQTANMLYDRTGFGIITADVLMNEGFATTTYLNRELLSMLRMDAHADPQDFILKPVTDLIDPLPRNGTFWSIVNEQRRVNNLEMNICAQGKTVSCIVSTDTNNQPALNVKCTIFYITTLKRISSQVSEKMGNNAIFSFDSIVGNSAGLRSAIHVARRIAQIDNNVILLGESGVGKDLFAQAIHNDSRRKDMPFIAVNCGALPRDLIASELFGYAGGAFTGAKSGGNIGKFELANGGTIFLDEIGELPLELQATLLRVVEQKQFTRLGSNKTTNLDVKIIAATNVDISSMIAEKRFRADLYYRLSTFEVSIPPLRYRGTDIILLAEYFIRKITDRTGRTDQVCLSESAKQWLLTYQWPGNVRELQNLMERIVQIHPENVLTETMMMEQLGTPHASGQNYALPVGAQYVEHPIASRRFVVLSSEEILEALRLCGNNKSAAARYLGIPRRTFYRRLHELGLGPGDKTLGTEGD